MTVTQKRCCTCGTDVSQAKRSKDRAGNYYCEACASATRARNSTAGDTFHAAVVVPSPAGRACTNCGSAVGALQQTWDWQGHQVCLCCRDSLRMDAEERDREHRRTAADAATRQAAEEQARQRTIREAAAATRLRRQHLSGAAFSPVVALASFAVVPICEGGVGKAIAGGFGVIFVVAGGVKAHRYRRACAGQAGSLRRDLLHVGASFTVGLTGGLGLVVLALALFALPFAAAGAGCWLSGLVFGADNPLNFVGLVAGFLGGAFVSLLAFLWMREIERGKCPACEAWFKSAVERSDVVGQDVRTVEGTRDVQIREGMFSFGKVVANLKVPTSRTVVTNQYLVQRRCRACGHRWTTR